jgi:hypothetical protein
MWLQYLKDDGARAARRFMRTSKTDGRMYGVLGLVQTRLVGAMAVGPASMAGVWDGGLRG